MNHKPISLERLRMAAMALALGMLLTACGGDDSAPVAALDNTVPPPSASASTDGQVAYVAALSATSSETDEPVILDAYTPPMDTSETAPPLATSADDS